MGHLGGGGEANWLEMIRKPVEMSPPNCPGAHYLPQEDWVLGVWLVLVSQVSLRHALLPGLAPDQPLWLS